ncbi:hydroxymethylbilane synthase [Clostridium botulinum]|uniref:hydroxymethylbilane synthase n=1 Tax=Clostridium botulinum TaxID=1491 RepID=UPI00211AFE53|nr:hydroxymethylbilane synthase [Clostridium botulinum]
MNEELNDISRIDLLQIMIYTTLRQEPILFLRFKISIEECYNEVLTNAQEILNIIDNTYPIKHSFKRKKFVTDKFLFSFSYSKFICKKYLNNTEMMDDYINKKFKSMNKGVFNYKSLNENLSEFSVFFYIFCGIYFKSELYKIIDHLDYEPNGSNNKKYEYTFVLKDKTKLNFEVKTLDCDPFSKDAKILKDIKLKDGDILGKAYFPNSNLEDFIDYKTNGIVEISSSYRQTNRNIRNIKKKFETRNDKDINIGVIVINYGTSREEFFSYLLNDEYGLINVQGFGNIDNLVLFSMCGHTTLMMNEIYENEHIFSVSINTDKYKKDIFNSLRLDNYIIKDGKIESRFYDFKTEKFSLYKYIMRNGFITIQPYYLEDNIIDDELSELRDIYNNLDEISKRIK